MTSDETVTISKAKLAEIVEELKDVRDRLPAPREDEGLAFSKVPLRQHGEPLAVIDFQSVIPLVKPIRHRWP